MRPAQLPQTSGLTRWVRRIRQFSRDAHLYLAGAGLMGIGLGASWVHLNLWYKAIGLDEAAIGSLLSLASLGAMVVAIPAAMLVNRVPAGRLLALAAAGFAASLAVPLLWPHRTVLGAASLLQGALFTVHWVAAAPFFMRTARPEDRGDLFGIAHAVETAATLLAAVGVGWLATLGEAWFGTERRGLELGLGLATLIAFAAVPFFAAITSRPERGPELQWRAQIAAHDWRLLGKIVLPATLVGCGAGFVIPFMNLYFRNRFALDAGEIGLLFGAGQVITTGAFLLGPWMARRLGSVTAIVTTELASIPFFLALAFTTNLPLAMVAFWMRGALMQMNQPISSAYAMELVPLEQQAMTNSLRHLAWNASWAISTQIGGGWIARDGFQSPILAAVGLYLMASVSFWWFFGRPGRRLAGAKSLAESAA